MTKPSATAPLNSPSHSTLHNAVFDVKGMYGAVANGIADDSIPIRNAVNACTAAGGGTVFFQPGTYKTTVAGLTHAAVTAELGAWFTTIGYIANVTSNTVLAGPGVIYQTGVPAVGDVSPWTNQYTVFAIGGGVTDVTFDGLGFLGENDPYVYHQNNQAACVQVYTTGVTSDITVQNCTFRNLYGFSYHCVGSSTTRVHALNNYFIECANGVNVNASHSLQQGNVFESGEGIEAGEAFTHIINNTFNGCKAPLAIGGDTSGTEVRGVVVSGNVINGTDDVGLVIADGIRGATIVGNTITRCADGAIAFTVSTGYTPSHCVFTGNNIYGNNAYPTANVTTVNLSGGGHHVFTGNRVWDDDNAVTMDYFQQIGVLVGASNSYIAANHIYSSDRLGTSYAISVTNGITATIGENYYEGVGRLAVASASSALGRSWSFFDGNEVAFEHRLSGITAVALFAAYGNGKLEWGTGSAGRDVSLSRTAANTLTLAAGDSFRTTGSVHGSLPVATGFAAGAMYYCISDKQPLWSDGTNWVEADGTNH